MRNTLAFRFIALHRCLRKKLRFDQFVCRSCSTQSKWIQPKGFDTGVKVRNSLCSQVGIKNISSLQPLILPDGNNAKWYMCGPTVYDSAHIGHASSYVRFDIIRRILQKFFRINVVQVMGITDIDDKIIQRANQVGESITSISRRFEQEFTEDLDHLKVLQPNHYTRVTDHIPAIQRFVGQVIQNGYAYSTTSGSVYFDVQAFGSERYGKLSFHEILSEENLKEKDEEKRHVQDFALWKAAKPGEPSWSSPWGNGRPGWHIECSVMSSVTFGTTLDIHTGGMDLAFPHHTNEIAQCEACFNTNQWANYFLHSGHLFLRQDDDKMSKSLGNVITIRDFLQEYTSNQFRIFCLLTRYNNNILYSEDSMEKAVNISNQITSFLNEADAYLKGSLSGGVINEADLYRRVSETNSEVRSAFAEDFNTPKALDAIVNLLSHTNKQLNASQQSCGCSVRSPSAIALVSGYISSTLEALGYQPPNLNEQVKGSASQQNLSIALDTLVSFRDEVRNWVFSSGIEGVQEQSGVSRKELKKRLLGERAPLLKASDAVREKLSEQGIQIKDRKEGSTWEYTDSAPNKSKE